MRPLITAAAVVVSLALAVTTAFAAGTNVNHQTRPRVAHANAALRTSPRAAAARNMTQLHWCSGLCLAAFR
jgi:hypothetical protein